MVDDVSQWLSDLFFLKSEHISEIMSFTSLDKGTRQRTRTHLHTHTLFVGIVSTTAATSNLNRVCSSLPGERVQKNERK